jgi:hypothetical protein
MNMNQIQVNINKTLHVSERGLNILGYIPIVSTFSGALRMSYGKLEVIGAIAAAALIAVKALCITNSSDRDSELKKAVEVFIGYALHGCANIIRGMIEVVPCFSLITCLPYDLLGHRYAYPIESDYKYLTR